jgi:hypothetical protein
MGDIDLRSKQLGSRSTGTTVSVDGVAISASTGGSFTTTSGSFTDVTNLSATITTSGRPVFVGIISDNSGSEAFWGQASGALGMIRFLRGATEVGRYRAAFETVTSQGPFYIDTPSAGTYTYKLQAKSGDGSTQIFVGNYKLVAFEL